MLFLFLVYKVNMSSAFLAVAGLILMAPGAG